MDRGPSFRIWTASLIHLVDRSDSLSITDAADQLITWFSWTAWSVRADLLDLANELERWLLVKARFVFDSTSDLCSCNLAPSFLPVSLKLFSVSSPEIRHTTTQQPWCLAVQQLLPDLQLQNWTLHTWTDSPMTRSNPSYRRCSLRGGLVSGYAVNVLIKECSKQQHWVIYQQ